MVLLLELFNIDRIGWVFWKFFYFFGDYDYIVNFIYVRLWVIVIVCVYVVYYLQKINRYFDM